MNDPIAIAVLVAGGAGLLVLVWLVASFNRFVRLRQHIRESWSGIDVELKRRYDLIPNLVETVKGYASHERSTLERVIELRNRAAAIHASAELQAADESELMRELKRVFILSEAYPQLRADQQFLSLQRELSLTEDRIAASRRFFNGNVREYNALRQSFPTSLIAGMFSFGPETYFELSSDAERVVPRIELQSLTQPGISP